MPHTSVAMCLKRREYNIVYCLRGTSFLTMWLLFASALHVIIFLCRGDLRPQKPYGLLGTGEEWDREWEPWLTSLFIQFLNSYCTPLRGLRCMPLESQHCTSSKRLHSKSLKSLYCTSYCASLKSQHCAHTRAHTQTYTYIDLSSIDFYNNNIRPSSLL